MVVISEIVFLHNNWCVTYYDDEEKFPRDVYFDDVNCLIAWIGNANHLCCFGPGIGEFWRASFPNVVYRKEPSHV